MIIGGMVLDIQASPSVSAKPRTTTPGNVCLFTFSSLHSSFTFGVVSYMKYFYLWLICFGNLCGK